MKKEINTTINNTEINTQEEKAMKNFELKKFEDENECTIMKALLQRLYAVREKFVKTFIEMYVDRMPAEMTDEMAEIQKAADYIIGYTASGIGSAAEWKEIFLTRPAVLIRAANKAWTLDEVTVIAEQVLHRTMLAIAAGRLYSVKEGEIDTITEQEDEDMKAEIEEKRAELIDSIESWYSYSYDEIRNMEQTNYKPWLVSKARELTANARGGDDPRDTNCTAIMNGIVEYVKSLPDDWFDGFEVPASYDELIELMYSDLYPNADFDLVDIPSRKEKFIGWLRDHVDARDLDFGEVEDADRENLKAELQSRYEDEDEEFFEGCWYDDYMSDDEALDYVNEHICNRYDMYEE